MGGGNKRPSAQTGPASIPSGDMSRGAPLLSSVAEDFEENIMFLNKNPGGVGGGATRSNFQNPTKISTITDEDTGNDFKNK